MKQYDLSPKFDLPLRGKERRRTTRMTQLCLSGEQDSLHDMAKVFFWGLYERESSQNVYGLVD